MNKQLPYLVANIVELLDLEEEVDMSLLKQTIDKAHREKKMVLMWTLTLNARESAPSSRHPLDRYCHEASNRELNVV